MANLKQTKKRLHLTAKIALFCMLIFLLAGSFVRVTGSGMGCPDWPKCYGYYIPPTDISTVSLEEGRSYEKGQMVIYQDTLWIAQKPFSYSSSFWKTNFGDEAALKVYPKHQYTEFNAFHTWTEFINRLLVGLPGIPILLMSLLSLVYYKKSKDYWPIIYSLSTILIMLFEAWLGKMVVDKTLNNPTVTYHMLGSLGIFLSLMLLIVRTSDNKNYSIPPVLRKTLSLFFLIHLVQLILGTQVRESVDLLLENGIGRNILIENLPVGFKIHRSFSILIVILATMMYLQYRRLEIQPRKFKYLFVVLGFEILFGVGMAYLGIPRVLQPLHLLFSIILFALSGMLLLESKKK